MNTRSFVGQSKKSNRTSASTGMVAQSRISAGQSQKRWQAKPNQTSHGQSGATRLTAAEQDVLLRQQALSAAQQGDRSTAIALFNALLKRLPQSAIDYSNRGLVHFQNGELDQALADYNKAIALNPRLDSAYNNRANYYAAQGEFLEAILDYDIALDLNPANVRAWINQGITFRELEMYDRALESFDLALCLGRLEGHIYAERGRTYQLQGDWNCAMADYYRALENLSEGTTDAKGSSRLRLQVENRIDELLSLALEEDEQWKL
jgi:tetratricopeptide (TPR) repeat protein